MKTYHPLAKIQRNSTRFDFSGVFMQEFRLLTPMRLVGLGFRRMLYLPVIKAAQSTTYDDIRQDVAVIISPHEVNKRIRVHQRRVRSKRDGEDPPQATELHGSRSRSGARLLRVLIFVFVLIVFSSSLNLPM